MRKFLCFILLLVLSGCTSWNIAFDPVSLRNRTTDDAEVVVIRDLTRFSGTAGTTLDRWVVGLDGHHYGELRPGQYTIFAVPTDEAHNLEVKRWDVWWHVASAPVIFEPGRRYYFLVGVSDLFSSGLLAISEEQGRAWMAKSRYVQVNKPM